MRVRWALGTLCETDQQVLRLVVWEGMTVRQAGAVLGRRPLTVRVRLRRARARLATALDAATASRRDTLKRSQPTPPRSRSHSRSRRSPASTWHDRDPVLRALSAARPD